MIAFRRILMAGLATLLFAGACTSVTIPSIPPINIPSIPPINIPSFPQFTIPPINLPSGGIGNFTLPPIAIPTSADANSGVCLFVSPAEMSQVLGAQATVTSNDSNSCTYTLPNFTAVVVTDETGTTDLSGVQFLLGSGAQTSTIGGFPAISGVIFGQPVTYVQKPTGQLQVLGVLLGSDQATIDKTKQIANIAISRMP